MPVTLRAHEGGDRAVDAGVELVRDDKPRRELGYNSRSFDEGLDRPVTPQR